MAEPTIPVDRKHPEGSLWARKKKVVLLFGAVALIILFGRFCGGPRRATNTTAIAPAPLGSNNEAVDQMRAQLEQERAENERLKGKQTEIQPDPNAQPLTGAQLQAIQQPQPAAAPVPKPEPHAPSLVVSFRDDTDEKIAKGSPLTAESLAKEAKPPTPASEVDEKREDAEGSRVPPELTASSGDKYRIRRGTLLPCTEMLRINGAFNGHINCLISVPIYSTSGQHLLIPQYSLALGRVEKVSSQNQERLFVAFDEIIEPDGYTITFKDADGLDQIGQTGLRDKVNRHYGQIFGASIAIALVGGLANIGAYGNGTYLTPASEYRAGVTQSLSESSMRVLDRFANVLPTFVITEGARNNLYIGADLKVPDYAMHQLKGDL